MAVHRSNTSCPGSNGGGAMNDETLPLDYNDPGFWYWDGEQYWWRAKQYWWSSK